METIIFYDNYFFFHYCRDSLHQHLDNVQGDLEALKEFLRNGEDYQADPNTLLNVSNFNIIFLFALIFIYHYVIYILNEMKKTTTTTTYTMYILLDNISHGKYYLTSINSFDKFIEQKNERN